MRTEQEIRDQMATAAQKGMTNLYWALKWVLGEQESPTFGEYPQTGPWAESWDPDVQKRLRSMHPRGRVPLAQEVFTGE
jgi:hypothetical protein